MYVCTCKMPARRKGAHLGRRSNKATNMRNSRAERTGEKNPKDNENVRVTMSQLRASQLQEPRAEWNQQRQLERRQARRFVIDAHRTHDQQVHRPFTFASFLRLVFDYEPDIEYSAHPKVLIGALDKECPPLSCVQIQTWVSRMCCVSGKVQLPEIETQIEPLNGTDTDSNLFLKSILTFNSCFQMASFGTTEIVHNTAANGQQFNSKTKCTTKWAHCFQCQMNHIIFYKSPSWAVRI